MINRFRPCFENSSLHVHEISQGKTIHFHSMYPHSLHLSVLCSYRILSCYADLSTDNLPENIRVPWVRALPRTSSSSTSQWIPCLRLVVGNYRPPQWTFTTKLIAMPGALKKGQIIFGLLRYSFYLFLLI